MKKSIKLTISGNVQGVGLRELLKQKAEVLGIHGTVQNSSDGTVILHVTGSDEKLEDLIDAIYLGTTKADVAEVAIESFNTHKDFRGVFRVIGEDQA